MHGGFLKVIRNVLGLHPIIIIIITRPALKSVANILRNDVRGVGIPQRKGKIPHESRPHFHHLFPLSPLLHPQGGFSGGGVSDGRRKR